MPTTLPNGQELTDEQAIALAASQGTFGNSEMDGEKQLKGWRDDVTAWQTGTGKYTPQPGPQYAQDGFDISGAGQAEKAYGQYGHLLGAPGATERFAGDPGQYDRAVGGTRTAAYTAQHDPMAGPSRVDAFTAGNKPLDGRGATESLYGDAGAYDREGSSTAAGQYWNSLKGASNIPKDMSAYYDRAREKGAAAVDRSAAARGQFNSSHAMDQQRELNADISARQAQDEAKYGLESADLNNRIRSGASQAADRSAAERFGQRVDSARASDSSGMGRYNAGYTAALGGGNLDLDRYRAGLTGAQQTDSAGDTRYGSQLRGATSADDALTGRISTLGQGAVAADRSRLDRVGAFGDRLAGLTGAVGTTAGGAYDDLLRTDQGLVDLGSQYSLGSGLASLNGAKESGALNVASATGAGQTVAGAGQDVQNILTQTSNREKKA